MGRKKEKRILVRTVPQKYIDEITRSLGKIYAPENNYDDSKPSMCPIDIWCAVMEALSKARKGEELVITQDTSVTDVDTHMEFR